MIRSLKSDVIFGFIAICALFNGSFAHGKIHEFETTRLKSTAGAGAGSLLVEESTVLNPASMAFFNLSSVYLQKSGMDKTTSSAIGEQSFDNDQLAVMVSDSNPSVSGSLSYIQQSDGFDKRKRFGLSLAGPIGESSSLGVAYRLTRDELSKNGNDYLSEKYQQTIFGLTHSLNSSFSFGAVLVDPLKVRPQDTKAILGIHYTYAEFIALMLDGGADYNRNLSQTLYYKAAIQFRLFEDFYLRVGTYNDKGLSEKGNGLGLGWVQPKLSIEVALKSTDLLEKPEIEQNTAKIRETSLSLSFRF